MKKVREEETQGMEIFCIFTSLAIIVLCVIFLFDLWQSGWFLKFILGLAILLHLALTCLYLIWKKNLQTVWAGLFLLFYAGALTLLK